MNRSSLLSRSRRSANRRASGKFRPFLEQLEDRSLLAVITVTGTGDTVAVDGLVTLREAIISANKNANENADVVGIGGYGVDTIEFKIAGPGVHKIQPESALPVLTDPVIIDGYTQKDAKPNTKVDGDDAVLLIHLDGSLAGSSVAGLHITAGNSTVRGLAISRFSDQGLGAIRIEGGEKNIIEGNFLGTDPTGMADQNVGGSGVVLVSTSGNRIGGTTPAARNIISGNDRTAVNLVDGVAQTLVQGNFIGINALGTGAVGNGNGGGVDIGGNCNNNTIGGDTAAARNIISGNGYGIVGSGTGTKVQGNYIGTSAAGANAVPNGFGPSWAVALHVGGDITIGGLTNNPGQAPGNLISGNTGVTAIKIDGGTATKILGNLIGTDVTGHLDLGNAGSGINITRSSGVVIGGPVAGAGNVISGNDSTGISIDGVQGGVPNSGTVVQGNFIGADIMGTGPLGNGTPTTGSGGIQILGSVNTIGGIAAGAGNVIAFNFAAGIVNDGNRNTIRGNSISENKSAGSNLGLGIAFHADGVALNDPGDGDAGHQNYPVLNAANSTDASTTITGTLDSIGGLDYVLDFYASDSPGDPSGHGEGQIYLGSVTFDPLTLPNFTATFPVSTTGKVITATATDDRGNTSEFSQVLVVLTSDTKLPTVTLNQAASQLDPTNTGPIIFAAVFNETVTGFDASDVSFAGSTVGGTLAASVSGTGASYTVSVSGMAGSGTVIASIPAGAATDAAGNGSTASTSTDNSISFDNVPPTVTINQAAEQSDPTSTGPIQFAVAFSEAVTDFTASDVSFAGSTVGGTLVADVTGSGANYTVSITGMTGSGTLVVSIPASAASDSTGNTSLASTSTDNVVSFNQEVHADLAVSIDALDRITLGNNLTYTITITDNGPDVASNVILTNTISPKNTPFDFVTAASSQGNFTFAGDQVTFTLGNLDAGASATATVEIRPTAVPPALRAISSVAAVTTSASDANPADNSASARTRIDRPGEPNRPGDLDLTFGMARTGKVTTDFGSFLDSASGVAIQSDGKIVAAGRARTPFGALLGTGIVRYKSNGDIDSSFDTDGKVLDFSSRTHGVAIQANGEIVTVGNWVPIIEDPDFDGFVLARFHLDGHIDSSLYTSFPSGHALADHVVTDFAGPDVARSVVIQADGRIVAAGGNGVDFAPVRYHPDVSLDTSFGVGGKVTTDFGFSDEANGVAIQPDGKIVAAGRAGGQFVLARYTPDGNLDTTFDSDGKVNTDFFFARCVAIQPDGKIIAAGSAGNAVGLVRLNSDGTLDQSFSFDGKASFNFSASVGGFANSLAVQPNGKIVIAGPSSADVAASFALARLNYDGSLDTSFGINGQVFPFTGSANGLALQPDGKIVVVGSVLGPDGTDFVVARFHGDSPDILVTGADRGSQPLVRVVDAVTGLEKFTFLAYSASFRGGVRVATGDVSGDGVPDIITAPGSGSEPRIKVFDGTTHVELKSQLAYAANFRGGVHVAVADLNGDGRADIITAPSANGRTGMEPRVQVFDGLTLTKLPGTRGSFLAFDRNFKGGVTVAAGDVNGDGTSDIIAGVAGGGLPLVRVFNGLTGKQFPKPIGEFLAFDSKFRGGVYVAAGDINGDGQDDIIVGQGAGSNGSAKPRVKVFSGRNRSVLADFLAYDEAFRGGVRVAATDVNGDGKADIITGAGNGRGQHVRIFDLSAAEIDAFFADELDETGGVFVAASRSRR